MIKDFDRVVMELDEGRGGSRRRKTFDELSMERSKGFVTALQELKNLQPQLYSAAEYCEMSYFNSEEKKSVLENLKDYTVRAVVNAVDHLGTVAFKLCDILDQKTMEVSSMELKVSHLNQQLFTCQTYMDKEGLRQQQIVAIIPRNRKHYMLPNSVNKEHFSPRVQTNPRRPAQVKTNISQSGSVASLSWHLASESKPSSRISSHEKSSAEVTWMKPEAPPPVQQQTLRDATKRPFLLQELLESSKALTGTRTFIPPANREVSPSPVRSRSMLSALFVKQKTHKVKKNMSHW